MDIVFHLQFFQKLEEKGNTNDTKKIPLQPKPKVFKEIVFK